MPYFEVCFALCGRPLISNCPGMSAENKITTLAKPISQNRTDT